jgi:hypothetical protein
MMTPQLVHSSPQGGTIHTYELSGGKTEFTRYLTCFLGSCKFCKDKEEAIAYLKSLQVLHKANI